MQKSGLITAGQRNGIEHFPHRMRGLALVYDCRKSHCEGSRNMQLLHKLQVLDAFR